MADISGTEMRAAILTNCVRKLRPFGKARHGSGACDHLVGKSAIMLGFG